MVGAALVWQIRPPPPPSPPRATPGPAGAEGPALPRPRRRHAAPCARCRDCGGVRRQLVSSGCMGQAMKCRTRVKCVPTSQAAVL
jgi:hypothetical protein